MRFCEWDQCAGKAHAKILQNLKVRLGVQDSETVLEHLVQQGQAQRALAVLRRPSTSPELHYKFAPALMAQVRWPPSAIW